MKDIGISIAPKESMRHQVQATGSSDSTDTWVVIAAFNEAETIGHVVRSVARCYPNIVVVDDGSSDATRQRALTAGATVLVHPFNLGQGAALQTGIIYACSQGANWIVTFDADGQHAAEDIAVLQQRQRESGVDVILGSRFLGRTAGMSRSKELTLKAAIVFTRLTTGMRLTDAHNGLRLIRREAAMRIRLRQNRMAHASEILEQIRLHHLSYAEAPVTITYNEYSMRKGQKITNSFFILMELILGRLVH